MDDYLIRHAEPDKQSILTGNGLREAEGLADYLRPVPLTHIYASPLARAQWTMQAVARGRSLTPVTLDWLAEMNGNIGCGHSTWTTSAAELEDDPGFAGRIAEYMAAQLGRSLEGFDALMAEHGYRREGRTFRCRGGEKGNPRIAIFAHGGQNVTLLAGLFALPLADFYAATGYRCTALTHLRMMPRRHEGFAELVMMSFAGCPHLGVGAHLMG